MDDAGAVEPHEALLEISLLRRRVRADRHAWSLPLLVMGLVAAGGSLLELREELRPVQVGASSGFSQILLSPAPYWALAVPLGFGLLAAVEWWRWRRRGVTGGGHRFTASAVLTLAFFAVPFAWLLLTFTGPFPAIGGGLLVAGVMQRHRALAVAGAVVGVLGTFEGFFGITNRLPQHVWRSWAHPAVYLAIAAAMVLAGLVALIRERSR